nr:hypothetical protein [uncultured Mucilaginibacter sp.]
MAIALIATVFFVRYDGKRLTDGYKKTFESSFNGEIVSIYNNRSTIGFTLINNEEYWFYQTNESYAKGDIFKLAVRGDTISKTAFSTDIYVNHKGKTYKFIMAKPKK